MYKVPNDECKIMTHGDGGKPFGKGELVRLFRGHRALSNVIERQWSACEVGLLGNIDDRKYHMEKI